VRLDPNDAHSLVSRAACLMDLGSLDQAEEDLLEAMNIIDFEDDESIDEEFHELAKLPVVEEVDTTELTQWRGDCRGYALWVQGRLRSRQGRFEEAISDLRKCCELGPEDGWRAAALAWMLATCPDERFRDGSEALRLAERTCSLSLTEDEGTLSTLAAALAEVGRIHDAVQTIRKALAVATPTNRSALEEELAAYEAGRPYRDPRMACQESLPDDALDDLSADRSE
jgi:Flp pilus assembly protein TadD